MKYKLNKGFVNQILGGKMTIFDGENSTLFTFNETATFIFTQLKNGTDDQEIVKLLVSEYAISESQAKEDLNDLILDLKDKKILK